MYLCSDGQKYTYDFSLSDGDLQRGVNDTSDQSRYLKNIFDEVLGNWYCHYKDGSHIKDDTWLKSLPLNPLFFNLQIFLHCEGNT